MSPAGRSGTRTCGTGKCGRYDYEGWVAATRGSASGPRKLPPGWTHGAAIHESENRSDGQRSPPPSGAPMSGGPRFEMRFWRPRSAAPPSPISTRERPTRSSATTNEGASRPARRPGVATWGTTRPGHRRRLLRHLQAGRREPAEVAFVGCRDSGAVRESRRPDHAIDDQRATPPRFVEQARSDHRVVGREIQPVRYESDDQLPIGAANRTARGTRPRRPSSWSALSLADPLSQLRLFRRSRKQSPNEKAGVQVDHCASEASRRPAARRPASTSRAHRSRSILRERRDA